MFRELLEGPFMFFRLSAAFSLFFFCFSIHAEETFKAKVIKVIDGDSLLVRRSDKSEVELRLQGIDAPEWKQMGGRQAMAAMTKLVAGKRVTVKLVERDQHGRGVAWVTLSNKTLVNREMVRLGWAWWYKQYAPDRKDLEKAEAGALKARRGLWALKERTPPWLYRRAFQRPEAKTPMTGFWLNTTSGTRHNSKCQFYGKGNGKACKAGDGKKACGQCGG